MKPKVELATPEKNSNFLYVSDNQTAEVVATEEIERDRSQPDTSCSTIPISLRGLPADAVKFTEPENVIVHGSAAAPIKNSKNMREMYDLKQLFNYLYFGVAAISILEVSRSGADIKCLSDYFYLGTIDFDPSIKIIPLLFLSLFFWMSSLIAARSAVKATAQDSSPFHFSRTTRKILRSAAIILPMPFIGMAISSLIGYQLLVQADNAYTNGKDDVALSYLQAAEKFDPSLKQKVLSGMAMTYLNKLNYTAAFDYAEKALQLDPTDANALSIEAFVKGDPAITVETARAATLKHPDDGHAFRVLAEMEYELGHIPEALAAARRHAELHDEEPGAKEYLAKVLLDAGKAEEALSVIGKIQPTDATSETHEIRADILAKLGRKAEASSEWDQARDLAKIDAKQYEISP